MIFLQVAAFSAIISYLLAGLARWLALRHNIIDRPNERSSHTTPTPRGGGIGIVVPVLGISALRAAHGDSAAIAILIGGTAIALIGWFDDLRGLSAPTRLAVHTAAAIAAVMLIGPGAPGSMSSGEAARWILAVPFIIWMTNLYNFMDGIDGLAATQALIAAGAAAAFLFPHEPRIALLAVALSASSAAFLAWNWSPAKIFMGDVGSGFIGYTFAVLALASESMRALPIEAWIILLSVFIVDATATLIRRILRGERWYAAHRTHAYQLLARTPADHRRVTALVALINLGLAGTVATTLRFGVSILFSLMVVATTLFVLWLIIVFRFAQPDTVGGN